MATSKRFKVALSFPGEHRAFIEDVANHLASEFGKDNVFYDNYHIDELARPNLDIYIQGIYKNDSELVAVFFCEEYDKKEWCGLEWRVMREMIKQKRDAELMPFRFDDFPIVGLLTIDGYIKIDNKTPKKPKEVSELILSRIRKNELAILRATQADSATLLASLKNMEKDIAELKDTQQNNTTPETEKRLQALVEERDNLKQQLLQRDDIIAQQEKDREELEELLAADKQQDELKQKALKAIEERKYDEAETFMVESAKDKIEEVAEHFYQLGKLKELKLEFAESLNYYELAAKIPPPNPVYLNQAALLFKIFGNLDKAIDYTTKCLEIEQQKSTGDNGNIATLYNNLALSYHDRGDLYNAIEYLQKALKIDLQLYGEQSSQAAIRYNNLGLAYQDKGDLNKAIEYLQKALKIQIQLFGEQSPQVAIDNNNLGLAYRDKGELDKAIKYLQNALKTQLQLFGEQSPQVAIDYNNLSAVYQSKMDFSAAIGYQQKALKIDQHLFGEQSPQVARDNNNIGMAFVGKEDFGTALQYIELSYQLLLKIYGTDNPSTKTAKKNLDVCIAAKNKAGKSKK